MDSGVGMTEEQNIKLHRKIAGEIIDESNMSSKSKENGLG